MKFFDTDIVFKEIPDEISLCFSMFGCPHKCVNCHWNTIDKANLYDLNITIAQNIADKYKNKVSCILFLGGEWDIEFIDVVKIFKNNGFKVALYTGLDFDYVDVELIKILDYIKVGRYIDDLGGLESPITNQVLYKLDNMEVLNYKLWRK